MKIFSFKLATAGLLLIGLESTALQANDFYMGADYVQESNSFTYTYRGTDHDRDNDAKGFKIKLGYEYANSWKLQGYFKHLSYDETVYGGSEDSDSLNEIGLDIIKGFAITPEFTPFLQVGLASGWVSLDDNLYTDSTALEINGKVGAGLAYKIIKNVEILGGVDFKYTKWQSVELLGSTLDISETTTQFYAGVNVYF